MMPCLTEDWQDKAVCATVLAPAAARLDKAMAGDAEGLGFGG